MHTKGLSSLLAAVFLANVVSPALLAGIPSKKAVYRGGTVSRMSPSTVGTVDITDVEDFVFRYKTAELRIVYEKVNSLEYGQKTKSSTSVMSTVPTVEGNIRATVPPR